MFDCEVYADTQYILQCEECNFRSLIKVYLANVSVYYTESYHCFFTMNCIYLLIKL